ncbi:MAG: hypothetical protein E7630_02250 [Ruminococcaceae bacterium]|nr:hypothetical protein [Oscillospiraceae bacterium]
MKKRLLCFLVAVLCLLPMALTGCSDEEVEDTGGKKPLTLTLYGITGESTTKEAIKLVEKELNVYTEGKLNTHIVLKLYPEDEYYQVLDAKIAEIERIKAGKDDEILDETTAPETDAETYEENGATKVVYPDVKDTQMDIFMVQGATNLNKYKNGGYLNGLNTALTGTGKLLSTYISQKVLATATLGGRGQANGLVDKGTVYGIPNNTVSGEYTYLLVNKELASKYYYSANDVKTLDTLAYFLEDAAKHSDYVTLYNEPVLMAEPLMDSIPLIGCIMTNEHTAFNREAPRNMLNLLAFADHYSTVAQFRKQNYITDGDYYQMPEDKKVAAAFIKGNAALPEQYEDEYFVIPYAMPVASADDYPGTMFCISSFTGSADRCMEVIKTIQTVSSFRNTFQYGVEGVHYEVEEFTGIINILNDDYSMDPADTGNLFLLTPNNRMSKAELALAANDWALGKQQYRDTVVSPYCVFDFRIITADNYKTQSYVYKEMYEEALAEAKAQAKAEGKKFDASKFEFDAAYPQTYTDEILAGLETVTASFVERLQNFKEYKDEDGNLVTMKDFLKILYKEMSADDSYKMFSDQKNPDSPLSQYVKWYATYGPVIAGG